MKFIGVTFLFCLSILTCAQDTASISTIETAPIAPATPNVSIGEVHGNFQADVQYYNPDSSIGAPPVPEKVLMNGFMNLIYTNGGFSAGLRYESYLNVMQGFDPRYKGNGIPYRFASYKNELIDITVGSYYEQFGNGLVFRSYEERGLGLDNAMDGFRLKIFPYKGIILKGVIGKQRLYFTQGAGIVRGADGEFQLNEILNINPDKKWRIILGGSFVSKYQTDQDPTLVLPENVSASAGRINFYYGNFSFQSEYAYKINDPSSVNNLSYKHGEALYASANYAKKGFSLTLSGKHIDNMNFRSDRTATVNDLLINYLPALSKQHTYLLPSFYPYASQPNGEISWQGELLYKFKKESKLGGPYGMDILINYSGANGLDTTILNPTQDSSKMVYKVNNYFGFGEQYFKDLVIEISRKFSKKFKATIMYSYQAYNKAIIQGNSSYPTIYSNIGVVDMTYKIRSDKALRLELQHLYTKQDHQSWAAALLEYTHGEHWFVALGDQWNYGNPIVKDRIHYYTVNCGYVKDATRISITYGKQRAGIFCVGGVCRNVPASNGIALTISSSF